MMLCPICKKGQLIQSTRTRFFNREGKRLKVILQTNKCDSCGETVTSAKQHKENLITLDERGFYEHKKSC